MIQKMYCFNLHVMKTLMSDFGSTGFDVKIVVKVTNQNVQHK